MRSIDGQRSPSELGRQHRTTALAACVSTVYEGQMRWPLLLSLVTAPTLAGAQALQSGHWDVTSTIVELAVPGVPGFLQRMARVHSSTEHKILLAGQGVEALLAPDPKARCVLDSQRVADGRYTQALTCPQKKGESLHIVRSGIFDRSGFSGQAIVTGATSKGLMRIVLQQHTAPVVG